MEIVIALVAVVIGFIIGRVLPRERPLGDLRVDRSDPTCEPYLFLELGTDVRNIMNKKHVTFRVKVITSAVKDRKAKGGEKSWKRQMDDAVTCA